MTSQIIVEHNNSATARLVRSTRRRDDAHAARLAQDIWQNLADLAGEIDGDIADLLEGISLDPLLPSLDFPVPEAA